MIAPKPFHNHLIFYAEKRQNSNLQIGDKPLLAQRNVLHFLCKKTLRFSLHPKNPRLRERPVKLRTLVRSRTLSADFYDGRRDIRQYSENFFRQDKN